MAEAFHSGFTALFVETPETRELTGENLRRLRDNLRLAEQLGAQIATYMAMTRLHRLRNMPGSAASPRL